MSIITSFSTLTGGTETTSYTVISGDTLSSIATKLVAAVNADTKLVAINVSATANNATLASTKNFTGNFTVPGGATQASIAATDGGANQVTNNYQLSVNGPATQAPQYDLNGNLVNDGTNTYVWDAENRLLQINYPGSGNDSQFAYDGLGRNVEIVEVVGGSVTSTKMFVSFENSRAEERNSSGTIISQYFSSGQTISGSNYFYSRDALGSVRELTDSSGNTQSLYQYDTYGRITRTAGSLASDFLYAGYYAHLPSGLYLTQTRAYSSNLGRFISRDSLEKFEPALFTKSSSFIVGQEYIPPDEGRERMLTGFTNYSSHLSRPDASTMMGSKSPMHDGNLYAYVRNRPVTMSDPTGLQGIESFFPLLPKWLPCVAIAAVYAALGGAIGGFAGVYFGGPGGLAIGITVGVILGALIGIAIGLACGCGGE